MKEVLQVENFTLTFHGATGDVTAVKKLNLTIREGEKVAIVGESGSGKTSLCRAILMLHAKHASVDSGRISLLGRDVTLLSEEELEKVRGRDVAMIFQDPLSSLNPVFSIAEQIIAPLEKHRGMDKRYAREYAENLLSEMGFKDPEEVLSQYPHELSGGMRQRVAIAIAICCDPKLIIADEPTSALDTDTQEKIMQCLDAVTSAQGRAMIFISHDLGLARGLADRIVVMKDGRIVEEGATETIFASPQEEYTKNLIRYAQYGKGNVHQHGRFGQKGESEEGQKSEPIIRVEDLSKSFDGKQVLNRESLEVYSGEILGIVGPSGCGKSTLARCIMGIHTPDAGRIWRKPSLRAQLIFQDSSQSLNPRMTVEQIIVEPLMVNTLFSRRVPKEISEKIDDVMRQVKLDSELRKRHPYDISGGQRQRVAIARALITDPDFIIADEPISSLDVSIQAQIIHLLKELRDARNLTMMIIAHDVPMLTHISDRILSL